MFRLKDTGLLASKAGLAMLPEGKLLINTVNAHSYNTAQRDPLFAEALLRGGALIPDGAGVVLTSLDRLIDWGRSNSVWSLALGTSCCAIEFMALGAGRYDMARFGFEVTRNSPRQADLLLVLGTITYRMAPLMKRLYDQMAEPKYVVAVGGCTISGGPFVKSYNVVKGIDRIIPVDVYIPGCPPRPEAFYYGLMQLQRKIKVERFLGGINRRQAEGGAGQPDPAQQLDQHHRGHHGPQSQQDGGKVLDRVDGAAGIGLVDGGEGEQDKQGHQHWGSCHRKPPKAPPQQQLGRH